MTQCPKCGATMREFGSFTEGIKCKCPLCGHEEGQRCSKCGDTGIMKTPVGPAKFSTYCDCEAGTRRKMVDSGMGVPG